MRIIGTAEKAREVKAVASGVLPSGQPIIVNADGTVSIVAETAVSQSIGTAKTVNTQTSGDNSAIYDSANNRVVVVYRDEGNSNYGTAAVGTITGTSLYFGSEVVFASEYVGYLNSVYDVSAGKVVVFYSDSGAVGRCNVGTVSGTSISFGSQVNAGPQTSSYSQTSAYDSVNQKIVIARQKSSGSGGEAFVGTVSGTSISFGSAVTFETSNVSLYVGGLAYNPATGKFVLAYRERVNNYAKCKVGTVSGTSISFGAIEGFNSSNTQQIVVSSDPTSNHVVIYYKDTSDSQKGEARVGTITGTSIAVGSLTQYSAGEIGRQSATYNVAAGKHVIFFTDQSDNTKGFFCEGTVSGTSVSFTSPVEYEAGTTVWATGAAYISDEKVVVHAFSDNSDSGKGKAIAIRSAYTEANLTSENYIGTAASGAPSGQGAKINIKGAVAEVPETIYEIVSASYDSVNFSVSGQDADPYGLFFRSDGAKMYVAGDAGNDINEYNLSTPWTVSSASYSQNFSVASQESAPNGVFFKTDGTKMFVVGTATDTVYEYALSSAWDISSASYGSVSFSVGSQDTAPTDLAFKTDGTKMFILGKTGDNVYEYALSSAWVVSSASYTRSFSVASQETGPTGLFFSSDGLNMVVVGAAGVNKYVLSSAWDISTSSYSQAFSVSSQENDPQALFFKSDGTKMYVLGSGSDTVYQYSTSVSLTPAQSYYVQTDGTLSTTAGDPSVFAGTAVAATKLIVKG